MTYLLLCGVALNPVSGYCVHPRLHRDFADWARTCSIWYGYCVLLSGDLHLALTAALLQPLRAVLTESLPAAYEVDHWKACEASHALLYEILGYYKNLAC